jgi:hypothetical protein
MRVVSGGAFAYDWDRMPSSGGIVSTGVPVCESVSTKDGGVAELLRVGEERTLVAVKYERRELPPTRVGGRLSSYVAKGA